MRKTVTATLVTTGMFLALVSPGLATVICPTGTQSYTLKDSDTCKKLVANSKLNFPTYPSIENINKKLTGFTCGAARKGQIICHPIKKETTHMRLPIRGLALASSLNRDQDVTAATKEVLPLRREDECVS